MTFREKVLAYVKSIPAGEVRTYGQVAELVGHPGAARAVGTIMKSNFDEAIPCHRVVRAGKQAGAYNRGGQSAKVTRLRAEGGDYL